MIGKINKAIFVFLTLADLRPSLFMLVPAEISKLEMKLNYKLKKEEHENIFSDKTSNIINIKVAAHYILHKYLSANTKNDIYLEIYLIKICCNILYPNLENDDLINLKHCLWLEKLIFQFFYYLKDDFDQNICKIKIRIKIHKKLKFNKTYKPRCSNCILKIILRYLGFKTNLHNLKCEAYNIKLRTDCKIKSHNKYLRKSEISFLSKFIYYEKIVEFINSKNPKMMNQDINYKIVDLLFLYESKTLLKTNESDNTNIKLTVQKVIYFFKPRFIKIESLIDTILYYRLFKKNKNKLKNAEILCLVIVSYINNFIYYNFINFINSKPFASRILMALVYSIMVEKYGIDLQPRIASKIFLENSKLRNSLSLSFFSKNIRKKLIKLHLFYDLMFPIYLMIYQRATFKAIKFIKKENCIDKLIEIQDKYKEIFIKAIYGKEYWLIDIKYENFRYFLESHLRFEISGLLYDILYNKNENFKTLRTQSNAIFGTEIYDEYQFNTLKEII